MERSSLADRLCGSGNGRWGRRRPHPPAEPASSVDLTRHVVEQGRRAAALGEPLALLGDFARLLAVLAPDRERQRTEPLFGNLVTALEAVAVLPVFEPRQRLVDALQRLGLHLDQRELDVFLDVRFRAFARVEHVVHFQRVALRAHVADLALHLADDLAAAILEDLLQVRIPGALRRVLFRLLPLHETVLLFSTWLAAC